MNNNILISIVIPTYNRSKYLLKILDILKSNSINFYRYEIIICDSFSKDHVRSKIEAFKSCYNNLNISYINLHKNIHSLKRNFGTNIAKGKYIIYLDDDCFPDKYFLKDYYNIFCSNKNNNNIYCGSVDYKEELKINNFLKYRRSRHFVINKKQKILKDNLDPSKIVTMNMGFQKNNRILNTKLFNKNFNSYGFEDYEFAYRISQNGFNIKACSVLIYHNDKRGFDLYLNKIRFLAYQSMKYLIKINYKAAEKNRFFILENNCIIKFLLRFSFINFILKASINVLIFLEKKIFYLPVIYKISIAISYLLGCFDRKKGYKDVSRTKKWYI
jgi:glycosyltransferase involved in cell wall biosynthesis